MLALSLGGQSVAWDSGEVLGLGAVAVVAGAAFVARERRAADPKSLHLRRLFDERTRPERAADHHLPQLLVCRVALPCSGFTQYNLLFRQ